MVLERKENIQDILLTWVWVFLAWLIWSIIILVVSFFLGQYTNIFSSVYNTWKFWISNISPLYPLIMSVVTLVWTTISSIITYYILWITSSETYKNNNTIFWQVAFFQVLVFICIAPIYIIFWGISFDNIMITYIFHIIIVIFWTNIILDILNNYRYVMIWIYWTFIWTFLTALISFVVFYSVPSGNAKLLALVFLLPFMNFLIIFLKKIFELLYYHFYRITWTDPIWDIFYKIKKDDEEAEKEESQKNLI